MVSAPSSPPIFSHLLPEPLPFLLQKTPLFLFKKNKQANIKQRKARIKQNKETNKQEKRETKKDSKKCIYLWQW